MPAARASRTRRTLATVKTIDRDATARDFEARHYENIRADAHRRGVEGHAIALRTRITIAESRRVIREVAASIERSEATIARSHDLWDGLRKGAKVVSREGIEHVRRGRRRLGLPTVAHR